MKQISIKIVIVYLALLFRFHIAAFAQDLSAADFLYEIGKEYYEEGDYPQALHELKKALLAEPEHIRAQALIEVIEEDLLTPDELQAEVEREDAMMQALEEAEDMDVDSGVAAEVFGVEDITRNHITNQHHTIGLHLLNPAEKRKSHILRKWSKAWRRNSKP